MPNIINQWDKYIVAFSGGKDSIASFLFLLENGVDKDKIELWHHQIDGKDDLLMDWAITEDYCRKFAEAFEVPIFFSWKQGGFRREMLRENSLTAPIEFETPNGIFTAGGKNGEESTRRKFPQVSPDLKVRWCSAYLKIDVCSTAIRNQKRFRNIKTVVISGERGEESPQRAKYNMLEPDRADLRDGKKFKRHVDRHRPIKNWTEEEVWTIIKKYNVIVHPAYYLGWSRCSCLFCIFGNADQFASAFYVDPERGWELANYEEDFKTTLKRDITLKELVKKGKLYNHMDTEIIKMANSKIYTGDIFSNNWYLPIGAYSEGCGPT